MSVYYVPAVPTDARLGYLMPWDCIVVSYQRVLGIEPRFSEKAAVVVIFGKGSLVVLEWLMQMSSSR